MGRGIRSGGGRIPPTTKILERLKYDTALMLRHEMISNQSGTEGTKAVSVIVTAYNRRQFLRAAVRSALRQSIPASEYEVVILTNFNIGEADVPATATNVTVIHDDSPNAGQTLAHGIREATGTVITFLDDDDLYRHDRLSRILQFFDRQKDLCYYHNAFTLFSAEPSSDEPTSRKSATSSVVGRLGPGPDRTTDTVDAPAFLRFLSARNHERNLSSSALRRDFALSIAPSFERVGGLTDTYLLFAALCSTGALGFDSAPLTMVRRHPSNTSTSNHDISRRRAAWRLIAEMVGGSDSGPRLDQYLALREARSVIFEHLYGEPAPRRQVWQATETALRSAPLSGLRSTLLFSALGLASTVSLPWLSAVVPFVER